MKKIPLYRYMGLNGILDTTILLEDTPYTLRYRLIADNGYYLFNSTTAKKALIAEVYEDSVDEWKEVKGQF